MKTLFIVSIAAFIFTKPMTLFAQTQETAPTIYTIVDQMPEFPGGQDALFEFIKKEVKYPAQAKKDGVTGKVFVTFVVHDDGSVVEEKIIRGVREDLDNEALRVIRLMPKWKPGQQNGKNVNVRFNIPLQFKLQDSTPEQKKTY